MLFEVLGYEEGMRETVYRCSEGYPTIGKGTVIGPKDAPLKWYTLRVNEKVADALMSEEVQRIRGELVKHRWYTGLNEDRQTIIKSMCYQMGVSSVFKFKKMIAALERGDYNEASFQALDSLWAKQTPTRAERHATVIACGKIMDVYEGLIDV